MSTDSKMLFSVLSLFAVAVHVVKLKPLRGIVCSCSSGFIPVPVDVMILVEPSNPDSTDAFRLQKTSEVHGVLCEPVSVHSKCIRELMCHWDSYWRPKTH
jgi:hypothetical protein